MGYSYGTFDWLASLGLTPKGRVLDLGSQDLYCSSRSEWERVNAFITNFGGASMDEPKFPAVIPTAVIWEQAGFTYHCVDVDGRKNTTYVDLQSDDFSANLKNKFDLVFNGGTTEHLSNPAIGFSFMHFACRDGGTIASDVPLLGMNNHALVNPTPKFWHLMKVQNHYDVVSAKVRSSPEPAGDVSYFNADFEYMEGLDAHERRSWFIYIAYKKTRNAAFVAPMDYIWNTQLNESLLLNSMRPLKAWSTAERETAASSFGAPKRRPFLTRIKHRFQL